MFINGREISDTQPPYLIAEISCNHNGSLDKALELIEAACLARADAVKFQLYDPNKLTLNLDRPDFVIQDGPWKGRRLHELYTKARTPIEWFPELFGVARARGITMFASVFDPEGVDYLESLGCPAYKIASFEITDTPLISHAASTGKPLIISTGTASLAEVDEAALATEGNDDFAMLHCVSGYPTPIHQSNLARFLMLSNQWGPCGISDHSLGHEVAVAATVLGACIIEKHLKLEGDNESEDAAFSLTPTQFRTLWHNVYQIWGSMQGGGASTEHHQLRRSLYAVEDIHEGELFTPQNVRSIRPGYGLPPSLLPQILGSTATKSIERGTPLTKDLISLRA